MNSASLNDDAWKKLFDKYNILRHIENDGIFRISASQIKEFREPRLMAKFDHTINLPKIFSENELAILPVTRGDYVISHFDAYHKFEVSSSKPARFSLPEHIQSLDSNNVPSEAIALNCAVASGVIADFMEDNEIVSTVSGRMGSGIFSFDIGDTRSENVHHIEVNNSQIEIDAAYEGISNLALIEAKRDLAEDFLIRQLYYPFRVWKSRVEKRVVPIFLVYSNGIYRLYKYDFENPDNYSSLMLIKQKSYSIEDTAISSADIQAVLENTATVDEPEIAFPQADKFERVINLCELLNAKELSKTDVTEKYAFDQRQTDYYTTAARYLGLLDKRKGEDGPVYYLSEAGQKLLRLGYKQRQLAFCKAILSHRVFSSALRSYFSQGVMPSKDEIVDIMKQSDIYKVDSDSTFTRRSSSVRGWVNWIVSLINE